MYTGFRSSVKADAGWRVSCQCLAEDCQFRTLAVQQAFDGLARCTGIVSVVLRMLSILASSRHTGDGVSITTDVQFVAMRGQTCLDTPSLAVDASSPRFCMMPHLVMFGKGGFCQGCSHFKPGSSLSSARGTQSANQEVTGRVVMERNRC